MTHGLVEGMKYEVGSRMLDAGGLGAGCLLSALILPRTVTGPRFVVRSSSLNRRVCTGLDGVCLCSSGNAGAQECTACVHQEEAQPQLSQIHIMISDCQRTSHKLCDCRPLAR